MSVFTTVSDQMLCRLVAQAKKRLFVMAPAISEELAAAICMRIKSPDCPKKMDVVVDPDAGTYRLGYGDMKSLDLLQEALPLRQNFLKKEKGVRICLMISDETFLVFSPTAKLIEAKPGQDEKKDSAGIKNAVHIPNNLEDIAAAAGLTEDADILVPKTEETVPSPLKEVPPATFSFMRKLILLRKKGENLPKEEEKKQEEPPPVAEKQVLATRREVGWDAVSTQEVKEIQKSLQDVPPAQFRISRRELVYNSLLEYVEFEVKEYRFSNKKLKLPPEVLRITDAKMREDAETKMPVLKDLNEKLVFADTEIPKAPCALSIHTPSLQSGNGFIKVTLSSTWIDEMRLIITESYCFSMGKKFGKVIFKRDEKNLKESLVWLRRVITIFHTKVGEKIESELTAIVEGLSNDIFSFFRENPPEMCLLENRVDREDLTDRMIKNYLTDFFKNQLLESFKFEDKPIEPVFKAFTYDNIHDNEIKRILEEKLGVQKCRELFEEHKSVKAESPGQDAQGELTFS